MPLLLEIVTPERLATATRRLPCSSRGSRASSGVLPHHTPLVSMLGVGELRIRKGGDEETFAIAGGFLQVRPDKVVVMAETADMASEIDLERAQEARREAEKALEGGYTRAPTWRRPGRAPARAPPHPRRRAPSPGGPAAPWLEEASPSRLGGRTATPVRVPPMADARPFHWEYVPEPPPPEAFRIEGGRPLQGTVTVAGAKNAALKLLAAADPDRRALPVRRTSPRSRTSGSWPRRCATWASSWTTPSRTSTRSRRATSTGCSCRSRPRPRCAPASCSSGRSWRGSGG